MTKNDIDLSKHSSKIPSEIRGLFIVILSIIMFLSLISFTEGNDTKNWLGLLGHITAWGLLYVFGLGSYVLSFFIGLLGFKLIIIGHIKNVYFKMGCFSIFLISICILLNLLAETYPYIASYFKSWIYHESVIQQQNIVLRQYLGGAPLYYLYSDLPPYNLKRPS